MHVLTAEFKLRFHIRQTKIPAAQVHELSSDYLFIV